MHQFVQCLESRRLLTAVSLPIAEANLTSDVKALIADAKLAEKSLAADGKTLLVDGHKLKNSPLKTKLVKAVASARTTIQSDVSHIITAGYKAGTSVVSDLLHIYFFDAGNPTKIARDQVRLAADSKKLRTVETPLINKLGADVTNDQALIGADVGAIVTANPTAQSLQTDWTKFSDALQSSKQTLVTDFTKVSDDLDAVTTAT